MQEVKLGRERSVCLFFFLGLSSWSGESGEFIVIGVYCVGVPNGLNYMAALGACQPGPRSALLPARTQVCAAVSLKGNVSAIGSQCESEAQLSSPRERGRGGNGSHVPPARPFMICHSVPGALRKEDSWADVPDGRLSSKATHFVTLTSIS